MNIVQQIENRRADVGMGIGEWSEKSGITKAYLYRLVAGGANPSAKVLGQIADPLGLEVKVVPKKRQKK